VLLKECLHAGPGVVAGTILNLEDRPPGLAQHVAHEFLVTGAVEVSLDALVEQVPTEELNGTKDFVGLSFTTGLDQGRVAPSGPGVTILRAVKNDDFATAPIESESRLQ